MNFFFSHWYDLNVCGFQKMYMLKSNHQPGDIRRQGREKQVSPECGISQDQCLAGIMRLPGAAFQFPPCEITVRSSCVVLFSEEVASTLWLLNHNLSPRRHWLKTQPEPDIAALSFATFKAIATNYTSLISFIYKIKLKLVPAWQSYYKNYMS